MTYRRVVNRNGLAEGDYVGRVDPVVRHVGLDSVHCGFESAEALEQVYRAVQRELAIAEANAKSKRGILLGDLRRLETDTADEGATCAYIAMRTGIDKDIVAAVLKEFIAW